MLAVLGDSVTTDHISPAGAIKKDSPAGQWLIENGVEPRDFNSYGSRRGNHEVMIRGTFANVRLRNKLVEREGGFTRHFPDGEETTIYEAAMAYADEGVPLVVLAGKEYGSGSSRDWAAKGTALLGVRAVIAESFERIHRSNLIGMGVLPLQLPEGETAQSLGLDGEETIEVGDLDDGEAKTVTVTATREGADPVEFEATVRLDTPNEVRYFQQRRHPPPGPARPALEPASQRLARISQMRGLTPGRAMGHDELTRREGGSISILVPGQSRLRGRSRRHPSLATDALAVARAVWTPCLPRPRPANYPPGDRADIARFSEPVRSDGCLFVRR